MVDISTLHPRGSRFNSCYHKIMRRGGGEKREKGEEEGEGKEEGRGRGRGGKGKEGRGGESFQILIFFNFLTRG